MPHPTLEVKNKETYADGYADGLTAGEGLNALAYQRGKEEERLRIIELSDKCDTIPELLVALSSLTSVKKE